MSSNLIGCAIWVSGHFGPDFRIASPRPYRSAIGRNIFAMRCISLALSAEAGVSIILPTPPVRSFHACRNRVAMPRGSTTVSRCSPPLRSMVRYSRSPLARLKDSAPYCRRLSAAMHSFPGNSAIETCGASSRSPTPSVRQIVCLSLTSISIVLALNGGAPICKEKMRDKQS